MTKKEIEKRLGCPIEKLPIGATAMIAANSHGHKGTFGVLRAVIMEDHTYPYIEFAFMYPDGRSGRSQCRIKDYGITWAASEDDWCFAKRWREMVGLEGDRI